MSPPWSIAFVILIIVAMSLVLAALFVRRRRRRKIDVAEAEAMRRAPSSPPMLIRPASLFVDRTKLGEQSVMKISIEPDKATIEARVLFPDRGSDADIVAAISLRLSVTLHLLLGSRLYAASGKVTSAVLRSDCKTGELYGDFMFEAQALVPAKDGTVEKPLGLRPTVVFQVPEQDHPGAQQRSVAFIDGPSALVPAAETSLRVA